MEVNIPVFLLLVGMVVCSGSTGNSSQPCRLLAITGHNATCVCSSAVASECDLNEAVVICQQHNNTEMHFQPGKYKLKFNSTPSALTITGTTQTAWIGDNSRSTTIICSEGAGLTFVQSSDITFKGINFYGCGLLQNSTSTNITKNGTTSVLQFRSALSFHFCKNVKLIMVSFHSSNGIGVVFFSTVGNNTIEHCTFMNNSVYLAETYTYPGGGALYIEFPLCNIESRDYNICLFYNHNSHYFLTHSIFHENTATNIDITSNHTGYVGTNYHSSFGKGGGLSLWFSGNSHHNTVLVSSCIFRKNKAYKGAGLYVSFNYNSTRNRLIVNNSKFISNNCYSKVHSQLGGGAAVIFKSFPPSDRGKENRVGFEDCYFEANQAYTGGAIALLSTKEHSKYEPTNSFLCKNSEFSQNSAHVGAALFASPEYPDNLGVLIRPVVDNCLFHSNVVADDQHGGLGIGTVYFNKISAELVSRVVFTSNFGTALLFSAAKVSLASHTFVSFINNTGLSGGALSILNSAVLYFSNGVSLLFEHNRAIERGGAIFASTLGESDSFFLQNCFIDYSPSFQYPNSWNVSVSFKNNTADSKQNSIYVTSVYQCLWLGYPTKSFEEKLKEVFCWEGWQYSSGHCHKEVTTAPSKLFSGGNTSLAVAPGFQVNPFLSVFDDLDHDISDRTVFHALVTGAAATERRVYTSQDNITVLGANGTTANLSVVTMDSRVFHSDFEIHLKQCPPGFVQNNASMLDRAKCIFGKGYNGFVLKRNNGKVYIDMGFCISILENHTVIRKCPYYLQIHHSAVLDIWNYNWMLLPSNVTQLESHLCEPINRKGFLCGDCRDNHSVAACSYSLNCVSCKNSIWNWMMYFGVVLAPTTFLFIMIFFFNISIASPPLNGFVFFAQAITCPIPVSHYLSQINQTFNDSAWKSTLAVCLFVVPYSLWNLDTLKIVIPPFCLIEGMTNLQAIALEYVLAVCPLLFVFLTYCLIKLHDSNCLAVVMLWKPFGWWIRKLRQRWDLHTSVIDSFVSCLILSYCKFCWVSFSLLMTTSVITDSGNTVSRQVLYAGNINAFSIEHAPYAAVSFFVLTFIVFLPLLILFLYPLKLFNAVVMKHFKSFSITIRTFAEAFNGVYKDGTGADGEVDCRFFAALFLLVRVIVILLTTAHLDLIMESFIEQVLCTILICLTSVFRPYKKEVYNTIDILIFSCLSLIVAISYLNSAMPNGNFSINIPLLVLTYIPLLYISGLALYKTLFRQLHICCTRKCSLSLVLQNNSEEQPLLDT